MRKMNFFNIPIFIISYNRTEVLDICLKRYVADGYKNIIIIDNASTDKRHVEYLKTLKCKVVFLDKNYGHRVLWECGLFEDIIANQYYVLTDPDVLPIEECPANYVEEFYKILQLYPQKTKVGFALKIDDLPEDYIYKYELIRYESFYWETRRPYKFAIYDSPIDTTFALYKPGRIEEKQFYDGIRTGGSTLHVTWDGILINLIKKSTMEIKI